MRYRITGNESMHYPPKRLGRKPTLNREQKQAIYDDWQNSRTPITEIAIKYHCSYFAARAAIEELRTPTRGAAPQGS